jgi:hypothetical protein
MDHPKQLVQWPPGAPLAKAITIGSASTTSVTIQAFALVFMFVLLIKVRLTIGFSFCAFRILAALGWEWITQNNWGSGRQGRRLPRQSQSAAPVQPA